MREISRKAAVRIIYWNLVVAVTAVCLSAVSILRRIHRYDALIITTSRELGVDPRLVSSLIWRESRFEADCVGTHNEVGLMQVTETAAAEWARACRVPGLTRAGLFDPATNIRAGTWYLARAIRRWTPVADDPLPFALAEYNAGRSKAQRWASISGPRARKFWEGIPYPTTKRYVKDILKRYRGRV